MLVCGNTASMVGESWLREHFTVTGNRSHHYGIFNYLFITMYERIFKSKLMRIDIHIAYTMPLSRTDIYISYAYENWYTKTLCH